MSQTEWLIVENKWEPELQSIRETQFTLGNGYIGSRGILEECPEGSSPGTFFAGIYDSTGSQVTELVNAPNPIDIKIMTKGERLGIGTMDVIKHKRILDMKKGMLLRQTRLMNARKKRFDFESVRFFGMHDKHIAVMRIHLTPLDEDAVFTLESAVDASVSNKGLVTEGNKKHFHISDFSKTGNIHYLCTKTLEKSIFLAYASQMEIRRAGKKYVSPRRTHFNLHCRKGERITITKYFSIYNSHDIPDLKIKRKTINTLKKAVNKGFERNVEEHAALWDKKWKTSDVYIQGYMEIKRAVRFNIYHLLIAGSEYDGNVNNVSIAAKTLSGEGYRGHVFWDTEIFILPFFIYTNPRVARNILLYRYNRLDAARRNAVQNNYKGAMFSWESADTGEEATPSWYKHIDGTIRHVFTGLREHHITADIAYAVMQYYTATCDDDFILKYGFEMILETARFWASRVSYNKTKKIYEIKNIIGPDEFHEDVNNNTFTIAMAQWNMETAIVLMEKLSRKYKKTTEKIYKKIGLDKEEIDNWEKIVKKIYIPKNTKGIIEQFEGYFKKKDIKVRPRNKYFLPDFPKNFDEQEIPKTQFVKQADVLMLFYLFPNKFSYEDKKKNYLFYESRTLHKSSLSSLVHSKVGITIGEQKTAYRYFKTAVYTDLKNIYGNSDHGMHAACLGGVWQMLVRGFGGMTIEDEMLSFSPTLPSVFKKMKFSIIWREYVVEVTIWKKRIVLEIFSKAKNILLSGKLKASQKYGFQTQEFTSQNSKQGQGAQAVASLPLKVYNVLHHVPVNKKYVCYRDM